MHGCLSVPPGVGIQGHLRTPEQWDPRKEQQSFPGKGFAQKGRAPEPRAFPQLPPGVAIVPLKAQDVCLWRLLALYRLPQGSPAGPGTRRPRPLQPAPGRRLRPAGGDCRTTGEIALGNVILGPKYLILEERVSQGPRAPRIWLKQSASVGAPGRWHSDVSCQHIFTSQRVANGKWLLTPARPVVLI